MTDVVYMLNPKFSTAKLESTSCINNCRAGIQQISKGVRLMQEVK